MNERIKQALGLWAGSPAGQQVLGMEHVEMVRGVWEAAWLAGQKAGHLDAVVVTAPDFETWWVRHGQAISNGYVQTEDANKFRMQDAYVAGVTGKK